MPKKPKLKVRTAKIIEVQDWDDLVQQTYNRVYSFQQQSGCKSRGTHQIVVPDPEWNDYENDTVPEIINGEEMGVSFKSWLARDPKQSLDGKGGRDYDDTKSYGHHQSSIDLWWERNFYPDVSMIVNDLHGKGLLEAGEYVINIDW